MQYPTKEVLRDMEEAHLEGWHDELPREFCPLCKDGPRICTVCNNEGHTSVDCPSLNQMETI